MIIKPRDSQSINSVIERGVFSEISDFALEGDALWRAQLLDESGAAFRVWHKGKPVTDVHWSLIGQFNVENALAAIAASNFAGVSPEIAAIALADFKPVKRRLEITSSKHGVTIFDDFAHHPTAIKKLSMH